MIRTLPLALLMCSVAAPASAQALGPVDVARQLIDLLPEGTVTHHGIDAENATGAVLRDLRLRFGPVVLDVGDVALAEARPGVSIAIPSEIPAQVMEGGALLAHGALRHEGMSLRADLRGADRAEGEALLVSDLIHGQMSTHPSSPDYPSRNDALSFTIDGLSAALSLDEVEIEGGLRFGEMNASMTSFGEDAETLSSLRDVEAGFRVPRSALEDGPPGDRLADLIGIGASLSASQGPARSMAFVAGEGISVTTGDSDLHASFASGTLDASQETRDMQIEMTVQDAPGGTITIDIPHSSIVLRAPIFPGPDGGEGRIALMIPQISLSENIQRMIDPEGMLPAGPFGFSMDLATSGRHPMSRNEVIEQLRSVGDINHVMNAYAQEYDAGELSIRELSLSGFGVTLSMSGDLGLGQDLNTPEGAMDVTLTGLDALVSALRQNDLIDPMQLSMGLMMIEMYFRQTEPDMRTATVVMSDGLVSVNGVPLQ